MFLHRILKFTAGGIFLIAIPLWAEQLVKFGKSASSTRMHAKARCLSSASLSSPCWSVWSAPGSIQWYSICSRGVGSGFDLLPQGQELIIPRFQFQSLFDGIQRAGFITKMRPQFAYLQPDPGIVRLLLNARSAYSSASSSLPQYINATEYR